MPKPNYRILSPFVFALFLLITAETRGATLYKNYVVRYDRGWDILCDPYRVQAGDWVLKIFRQKGEISHYDFREFLGIFQRLNPHIKDIDRIRPGQVVDIPLKKLAKGNLPGQSSGVVTIPFVMISSPQKKVEKHSETYTIQKGDTVSILIAKKFGGSYGSETYSQGLALFKAINPNIEDINRIYAGQQVYMPAPSIREQSWYASLFDEKGNLAERSSEDSDTDNEKIVADAPQPRVGTAGAPLVAEPAPKKDNGVSGNPAADAALAMEGHLLNKGTLFLPVDKEKDFEIDLSQYPMIDFGHGEKAILTTRDKVMDVDLPLIQSYWDNVNVVKIPEDASSKEILGSILSAFSGETAMDQLAFKDGGVTIQVKAKWIRSHPSPDGQILHHTCITLISSSAERTHDTIVGYLDQNDILIQDVSTDPSAAKKSSGPSTNKGAVERIDGTDLKSFIADFSRTMGFTYSPNTQISFPYAGVQVEALSNLLSFGNGKQVLLDYGDLYGEAQKAIEATGLDILKFTGHAEPFDIIKRLMEAAGVAYTDSPLFYGADRPADFNTVITVEGVLAPKKTGRDRLFVEQQLPEQIENFILEKGIQLVIINK